MYSNLKNYPVFLTIQTRTKYSVILIWLFYKSRLFYICLQIQLISRQYANSKQCKVLFNINVKYRKLVCYVSETTKLLDERKTYFLLEVS